MGDEGRALDTFNLAIANIGIRPAAAWWFDNFYYTPERDLAGLIAIAAETGHDRLATALVARLRAMDIPIDWLNTQDKAWLLAAAHALNRNAAAEHFAVDGGAPQAMTLPASFNPGIAAVKRGYAVQNAGDRPLWLTLTVTGAPIDALPALARGYTVQRQFLSTDGKAIDPAHLRQNDRFIVSLRGSADDDAMHRTVLVNMLPAGWEIEAPITRSDTYGFLGPLSRTHVEEARDDRFVAAFDLGHAPDSDDSDVDDSKPHLAESEFHVAFLVRVVTPGHFTLPEAVVSDMYRPELMARTGAGETDAAAR
jgi:alpha-2-macroglobulin